MEKNEAGKMSKTRCCWWRNFPDDFVIPLSCEFREEILKNSAESERIKNSLTSCLTFSANVLLESLSCVNTFINYLKNILAEKM